MFGSALILFTVNHLYFGLITPLYPDQIPSILQHLQTWSLYPGLIALGIIAHQTLFNQEMNTSLFYGYIILVCASFPLVFFDNTMLYSTLIIYGLAIEICMIILFDAIRKKAAGNFILLFSIISYSVGGMMVFMANLDLSIFAFFSANAFLVSLIAQPKDLGTRKSSMTEFFNLKQELQQTKKQLSNQEHTFKALFDEMVDPVMILDHKGIVLEATRRIKDYTGYAREELLHTNIMKSKLMTRKAKMIAMANLVKRMSGMHIPPYEINVVKKNGELLPVEINARKINFNGKHADMIVFRDISDRKRMEENLVESEKKYRELFNNLRDAMAKVDMNGMITECNPAFLSMLGYTFDEVQQLTYEDITPTKWHQKETEILNSQVIPYGYSELYKKEYRRKDGMVFPVELNTYLIKDHDQKPTGMWALVRDISDREAYQKRIHDLNDNLELKVKQRTMEVEKLLEQKNEFIHLLAHDLKNPMAAPLTLLPIIQKKVTDPKMQEIVDVTLRNINKMKQLIDDTLQLARIDDCSSTIALSAINLHDFIEKIETDNQDLLNTYQFHLQKSIPMQLSITGDPFQLEEVVNNLISNSVKYTKDTDERVIYINASEEKNEVIITVSDKGQGIPIDEQDHVFDKFYKTGTPRKGMNSTGLGLSLCRSIIERHGGRIWMESKGAGKGSSFSFALPKKTEVSRPVNECHDSHFIKIRKNIDDLLKKRQIDHI